MDIQDLLKDLKRDEGFRSKPYKDTVGKLTIGYGRNLDDVGITEIEAESLLKNDINKAARALLQFYWYRDLSTSRHYALINMMFNLGLYKFRKFKRMIAAFEGADYEKAADEALDSKWARQVGDRAIRIADLIRIG